ncbi:transcriptional regulator, GntR family [Modestobacter sp. DSM 44400]|uniref:GntR family transcriptional regulator n=1 Tax=Modestobacter sp. DSM 44400 TaxID=1550230 RepID=UPI0008982F40|nr:GntR family transcriptional regulator [Modestobacter sp. DSM 44400]SDX80151.1 transcriptional regulator, GntR family [Modestobacter sp. DSM 44400]
MSTFSSKTDMVTATLRELILVGDLRPGEQLRQRELSARLCVSQTPVREALRRLESEGLVVSDSYRGSTVAEAGLGATEENYQLRAALEGLGSSLAAAVITEPQLASLEAMNRRLTEVTSDHEQYAELNRKFHFAVYEYANSPLLLSLMRLLWQSMPGGPKVLRSHAESVAQHGTLLDALRDRDAERAAEVTRRHILGSAHLDSGTGEELAERGTDYAPTPPGESPNR